MTLWDVRRNTGWGKNKWNCWPVKILSVDKENRSVIASWNVVNAPEKMSEQRVCKYRAKKPAS
jgi:hypothetical protein